MTINCAEPISKRKQPQPIAVKELPRDPGHRGVSQTASVANPDPSFSLALTESLTCDLKRTKKEIGIYRPFVLGLRFKTDPDRPPTHSQRPIAQKPNSLVIDSHIHHSRLQSDVFVSEWVNALFLSALP